MCVRVYVCERQREREGERETECVFRVCVRERERMRVRKGNIHRVCVSKKKVFIAFRK